MSHTHLIWPDVLPPRNSKRLAWWNRRLPIWLIHLEVITGLPSISTNLYMFH